MHLSRRLKSSASFTTKPLLGKFWVKMMPAAENGSSRLSRARGGGVGRKWRCIICAYFMWLPLSGALIILLITCCKYGKIIQIYSSSSRFSPHKAPHSCLVLPPPPPPLLFLSSLLVTPQLPLSLPLDTGALSFLLPHRHSGATAVASPLSAPCFFLSPHSFFLN